MTLNPRFRSDSVQTSGSSTQSFENKTKDVEPEEKGANARRRSQADILTSEEEKARQIGAMAKARSESLGKIARSPSAPEKERPRVVDISSLSRSSSAPQGPTPEQASSLREGIVLTRRAEEEEGSASSSSLSLNDSGGDPDIPSRKILVIIQLCPRQNNNQKVNLSQRTNSLPLNKILQPNKRLVNFHPS